MVKRLEGKVAVVTGGSLGIGAGIAGRLSEDGAAVVLTYGRNKDSATAMQERIRQSGGKALAVQADVRDRGQLARVVETAKREFGRLDILVNNAGVYEFRPLEAVDEDHFDRQFDTNVKALLFATQEAVKAFDGGGAVINISSLVSEYPVPNGAVYSATKAAVDAITKSLAAELGPKQIRVNSVAPGMVITEGLHAMAGGDEFQAFVLSRTPLGRHGTPRDIAGTVAFLASPEAEWITGQVFTVSGGTRG